MSTTLYRTYLRWIHAMRSTTIYEACTLSGLCILGVVMNSSHQINFEKAEAKLRSQLLLICCSQRGYYTTWRP